MEDVHRIVPHLDGDPHTAYFAVYDGHGGMKHAAILGTFMLGINVARVRYPFCALKDEALLSS